MRRIIALVAAAIVVVALSACEPPTVTATPSTLRPGYKDIVTVTGVGTPASEIRNVVLEYQQGSTWKPYFWFRTGAPGETREEIRKAVNADGTYTFTHYRPQMGTPTMRFRVRGMKKLSDTGVVSKSWYLTPPTGC